MIIELTAAFALEIFDDLIQVDFITGIRHAEANEVGGSSHRVRIRAHADPLAAIDFFVHFLCHVDGVGAFGNADEHEGNRLRTECGFVNDDFLDERFVGETGSAFEIEVFVGVVRRHESETDVGIVHDVFRNFGKILFDGGDDVGTAVVVIAVVVIVLTAAGSESGYRSHDGFYPRIGRGDRKE